MDINSERNTQTKVLIMLATFNGEKWIKQQLISLFSQKEVDIKIAILDNGSNDNTLQIIQEFKEIFPKKVMFYGVNKDCKSASANFFSLVRKIENIDSFDYFAFCDQDDIWLTDKLKLQIQSINKKKVDAISCNVIPFYGNGKNHNIKFVETKLPKNGNELFDSPSQGCTFVFNKKIMKAFARYVNENYEKLISEIYFHDWLLYSFSINNKYSWAHQKEALVLYRQHDSNVFGYNNGSIRTILKRVRFVNSGKYWSQILFNYSFFSKDFKQSRFSIFLICARFLIKSNKNVVLRLLIFLIFIRHLFFL